MRRREFITLIGAAATLPFAASAQQPAMPVIGFLSSRTAKQAKYLVTAIHEGLKEEGYIEGQNVTIEYSYAESHYEQIPTLAANLVDRQVAVIIAGGTPGPAIAATRTIPVVFTTGLDPVLYGLVNSLSRPSGNVTGATFYSGALGGKQMEILSQLAPKTTTFGLLVNPTVASAASQIVNAKAAARSIGRNLQVLNAASERDIDLAFATLAKVTNAALLVGVDPFFDSRPNQLVELAARHALPTAYYLREFVEVGGLMSYGARIVDTYRRAGAYAGKILKGAKPSDLPVQLPTRFELVINLKTAKAQGITVPPSLLVGADEVIE
jgi:putative tryptophan/tyrosine transport system substrate-binding protein